MPDTVPSIAAASQYNPSRPIHTSLSGRPTPTLTFCASELGTGSEDALSSQPVERGHQFVEGEHCLMESEQGEQGSVLGSLDTYIVGAMLTIRKTTIDVFSLLLASEQSPQRRMARC